jgi:hypothetical protein
MVSEEIKCLSTAGGILAIDILKNNFHKPFINGKCNRDSIHDAIVVGIMANDLGPIKQMEVEFACDLIDELLEDNSI